MNLPLRRPRPDEPVGEEPSSAAPARVRGTWFVVEAVSHAHAEVVMVAGRGEDVVLDDVGVVRMHRHQD